MVGGNRRKGGAHCGWAQCTRARPRTAMERHGALLLHIQHNQRWGRTHSRACISDEVICTDRDQAMHGRAAILRCTRTHGEMR